MPAAHLPPLEKEPLKLTGDSKEALEEAHSNYTAFNPASLRAHRLACQHQPGGNTRTVLHANPFPLTFTSGNGCTLTSLDGHTYVDFLGEYTAGIYGHNNATIHTAITEALHRGWSLGGNNSYEKELASLVCERFAPTMELVRFTNSGTEANMMAVATAMAWTGRKKILVFRGGYHGATLSFRNPPEGLPVKSVNLPHQWVVGTYNDIASTEKVLSTLPPESLAAILVEPLLGNAGAIPGSLPFLQYLRSYASSNKALLIFDEVMTSRLSYHGLGHRLGIQPDLMTLGKWVGGGMSFGAFGGRKDIMGLYDPSKSGSLAHAGTFNNNVISMAAGCAGCKVLDLEITNRLNDLGECLKERVTEVIQKHLRGDEGHTESADEMSLKSKKYQKPVLESVTTNGTADGAINGTCSPLQHHQQSNGTIDRPSMYISGMGSILAMHFPPSPPHLQSLFYHHMLSKNIYLAERGFMALNIELSMKEVNKFVAATGDFIEKYKDLMPACWKKNGD